MRAWPSLQVRHLQGRLEDALQEAREDARRLGQEVAGLVQAREEADREAARLANELAMVGVRVRGWGCGWVWMEFRWGRAGVYSFREGLGGEEKAVCIWV